MSITDGCVVGLSSNVSKRWVELGSRCMVKSNVESYLRGIYQLFELVRAYSILAP
jgi:hypothetical protein